MKAANRFKLLFGPYVPPRGGHKGSRLFCEIRGTVTVGGFRDGEIPWPKAKGARGAIILCGDLVKAVKRESSVAVCHHFGLCVKTVTKFRRALKVPRENEGSVRLWHDIALERKDDRFERAQKGSMAPAIRAKIAAKLRGRIIPQSTIDAVRRAAKRPRSEVWKKKMSDYWRKRGHPPGHPELEFWAPEEDALLGTDTDANIARRLERPYAGVVGRRKKLGIAPFLIEIDGKKLRRLRKRKGLTQQELSTKAGAYRDAVVNMERGMRARLRRDLAQRIAAALGCSVDKIERAGVR